VVGWVLFRAESWPPSINWSRCSAGGRGSPFSVALSFIALAVISFALPTFELTHDGARFARRRALFSAAIS
jgi:hypothetical protein